MHWRIATLSVIAAASLLFEIPICLAAHTYWVPYKDITHFGPSGTVNRLSIFASQLANVNIDGNDTLLEGNHCHALNGDRFHEGSKIVSDVPIQVWYYYSMWDFGAYEDGELQYEIVPEALLGNSYWLPVSTTELAILATSNGTTVQIGANNYNLNQGQTEHVLSLPPGAHITSNNPISVLAVNYGMNCYDNTHAFPLYAEHMLDTVYSVPHQHPYGHRDPIDSSKVWVVATQNNTTIDFIGSRTLNRGDVTCFCVTSGGRLTSDKPVGVVWISDVYAREPSGSVYRYYTYAIAPIPEKAAGKKGYFLCKNATANGYPRIEVFITSLQDNNIVQFDVAGDGSIEDTRILNRHDTLYRHEEDLPGWDTLPLLIEGTEKLQITFSELGWWGGTSDNKRARTVIGLDYSPIGTEDGQEKDCSIARIQVFPNPFSEHTRIRYSLRNSSDVKLSIHDIAGRLVRTLRDGHDAGGEHCIVWDGTSNNGILRSEGVYFCVMEANRFRTTQKVTLIK